VFVCCLSHLACNLHAPYCYMWPAGIYNIFHIIPLMARFKKKLYWTWNVCLFFYKTFVWNIPHFQMKWARYVYLNMRNCSSCNVRVILVRF